jgi:hypothetical protein
VKYIELMILWRDALFKVACVDPGLPKSKKKKKRDLPTKSGVEETINKRLMN